MKRNNDGFTLLEIMLVVTIIALLLGAAIYKLGGNVEYSRHVRISSDIQGINTQLKLYESMNGFFRPVSRACKRSSLNPAPIPRRRGGINSTKSCQRIRGITLTSTSTRDAKIQTATISIPPDRIADRILPTTIGAVIKAIIPLYPSGDST